MNVGVRVDRKLDHATIVLSGPFNLAHSTDVIHAVKSAEAQLHNCRSADISLAQVNRIDGSGAVLLARLLERLAANGCRTDISEGNNPEAQHEANVAIKKAIDDQMRHMLIAMATGTRKTFTLVDEVYRLMKSGVAKRILFLVDRRALAAQVVSCLRFLRSGTGTEVRRQRFHREDFGEDGPSRKPFMKMGSVGAGLGVGVKGAIEWSSCSRTKRRWHNFWTPDGRVQRRRTLRPKQVRRAGLTSGAAEVEPAAWQRPNGEDGRRHYPTFSQYSGQCQGHCQWTATQPS